MTEKGYKITPIDKKEYKLNDYIKHEIEIGKPGKLMYIMVDKLNELHDEKEFWKSMCCSQSNFNQILLNELDIAQEQGYEISNPFKRFLEGRGDYE